MNCIIVEDEQLARNLVESYIGKIPGLKLIASCKNGNEALGILSKSEIDLIITDIQMPSMLGTDMLKSISNLPLVIFTTAYKDFAFEGFELDAVDYLLKPFSFEKFEKAVNKAKLYYDLKSANLQSAELKNSYLTIKADHKLYKVHYEDIKYIEGMREYVSFYTANGRITALMALKNLENNLPKHLFIRCHKSYIVNKNMVQALDGMNLVIGDKHIPVGQSYKDEVLKEVF